MHLLLTIIHATVCFILVFVVLIQSSKGAQMGAAFGGSSQTVFGTRGAATFLSKMTTTTAIIFMVTSLVLAVTEVKKTSLVAPTASPKTAPAANIPAKQTMPQQLPVAPSSSVLPVEDADKADKPEGKSDVRSGGDARAVGDTMKTTSSTNSVPAKPAAGSKKSEQSKQTAPPAEKP